ncbi:hypothetical protein FE257_011184 [Aspergillus nanangensis]|uniref:Tyrosine specific protein phosphatases domain-containing protein n=1 Tax=Aspergillus nanangensis TaxID=2582783 RepID=A0AAD4CHN5_ASPNN|nr:hypothetical protein FE257_011184 [Aspergillus nanangensis]
MDQKTMDLPTWLDTNRFTHSDFTLATLAQTVQRKNLQITVLIPAKEVAPTIGNIIQKTIHPLIAAQIVHKLYIIDAASADHTASAAHSAGHTHILQRASIAPSLGPSLGKGDALWRGLLATDGDIVAFLDGDTQDPVPAHLLGILGPLIMFDHISLVKACFNRPFRASHADVVRPHDGGRVTELLARPLLNRYWPELAGFGQPLAGEFAGRRALLEELAFPVGYGVEIGTLVDAYRAVGLRGLADVDVGQRQNTHQELRALTVMAGTVLATAERRRSSGHDTNTIHGEKTERMYLPWEAGYRTLETVERPAVREYREQSQHEGLVYPSPPFLAVEGVRMFRDVGASSRACLRPGLVFRSGELSRVTAAGLETLRDLGVKKVFDLRSPVEMEGEGHHLSIMAEEAGWERVAAPVFPDEAWQHDKRSARLQHYANAAEGYTEAYLQILQCGVRAFEGVFQHLAQADPSPILVHCTAGKDRTGVTAMLILLLAGCDDDTIADEYALNDMDSNRSWGVRATERLLSQPGLRGNVAAVENVVRAQKEYMLATLRRFRQEYGGVEKYLERMVQLDGRTIRAAKGNVGETAQLD